MPNIDLIFAILISLGPYFLVALLLAVAIGFFIPWGMDKPVKWLYFYVFGISTLAIGAADGTEGSLLKQVTWAICYALCAIMLYVSRDDNERQKIIFSTELLLLIGWMALSIAWSPYPLVSLKRFLLIMGSLLIAGITTRMTPVSRSSTQFLLVPLICYMLLGVVHAIAFHGKAFDADGAMRGYSTHKNPWGQFCLLAGIVFLHSLLNKKHKLLYAVLLIPTVGMLLLSKSATSILAFGVTTLLLFSLVALVSHRILGATLLSLVIAVGSLAVLVFTVTNGELPFEYVMDSAFRAADKSTTLTGRTYLWYLMWGEISQHLWTGTGIGGFWTGPEGASGILARKLDWGPPGQAHSGYIDILNEIGVIGSIILLIALVRHAINLSTIYRRGYSEAFMLHACVTVAFLIINYAETTFFLGSNLWYIVFISSVIQTASLCASEAKGSDIKRPIIQPSTLTRQHFSPNR